jgi:hypothetical protein
MAFAAATALHETFLAAHSKPPRFSSPNYDSYHNPPAMKSHHNNSVESITLVNIEYFEKQENQLFGHSFSLIEKIHKFILSMGLSSIRMHNFNVDDRRSSPIIVFSILPNHLLPVSLLQYNMKVLHTCNV